MRTLWSEAAPTPLAHRPLAVGGCEFDATNDKHHFDFGRPDDAMWPVYKGASFNLWEPDTGTY